MHAFTALAAIGAAGFALEAAHVADHWVQTQHQADVKGRPGWPGRLACDAQGNVATYTLTTVTFLPAVAWRTGYHPHPVNLVTGLAVSAVTHHIADRRTPQQKLPTRLRSGTFYMHRTPRPGLDDNPSLGTQAHALDLLCTNRATLASAR
jgi:hypothetical protein